MKHSHSLALVLALGACGASHQPEDLERRMSNLEDRQAITDQDVHELRLEVKAAIAEGDDAHADLEEIRRKTREVARAADVHEAAANQAEAEGKSMETAVRARRAPTYRQLRALQRETRRVIGRVAKRSERNRLINDLLAIDISDADIDVKKRQRAHRGLKNLLARAGEKHAAGRKSRVPTYQALYKRVGRALDRAGLPAGHPLVAAYLDINFHAGVENDDLRRKYVVRLAKLGNKLAQRTAQAHTAPKEPKKKSATPRSRPFQQYTELYRRVGDALDQAALPSNHPLIRQYLDINYQSGIMNESLRKQYMRRLRHIGTQVRGLRTRG